VRTECCGDVEPKDLVTNERISLVVWKLPLVVFMAGFFTGPTVRAVLWTVSLGVAGAGCLVNAARCGRVHCYFTGPLFLIGAGVSLAHGVGLVSLSAAWWIGIGVAMILGDSALILLPERVWGKYRRRDSRG
jgi:hypothetical protein